MPTEIISIQNYNHISEVLNKIFNFTRLVNPLKKDVVSLPGEIPGERRICHEFWSNGKVCSNCISMRALNEKDTFFKLEWADDRVYMVMAIPVQYAEDICVLELVKDVTNSLVVEGTADFADNLLLETLGEIGQLQIKDELTGLFNRRFIDERLPADIHNSIMESKLFTLIFADIDRFKLVNDTYGHVAGDHVLKALAGLLRQSVTGDNDWVARYGGEEFLIFADGMDEAQAAGFAEMLRSRIESTGIEYEGNMIRITVSFGVCTILGAEGMKPEELIECVDKNLYEAKSSGRNRVVATRR